MQWIWLNLCEICSMFTMCRGAASVQERPILPLTLVLCAAHLSTLCSATHHHFLRGSLTYEVVKFSSPSNHVIRVTSLTSWVLGQGPCGANCTQANVGDSTTAHRRNVTDVDPYYFGKWSLELVYMHLDTLGLYSLILTHLIYLV